MSEQSPHRDTRPLEMRGYRRHRPQSPWGGASLVCPFLSLAWAAFWYLTMSQRSYDPQPPDPSIAMWRLFLGSLTFASVGVILAVLGMWSTQRRRHLAVVGLAVNLLIFVGMCSMLVLYVNGIWFR